MAYEEGYERSMGRDADLVLSPGEYAFVQDGTKGHVTVYVGPHKTTISQTDNPVNWNSRSRRFEPCNQQQAVHSWPTADEGSYIVLEDPAPEGGDSEHPVKGTANANIDLRVGRKVNIPGPTTFALWPGQSAEVVPGHRLRSNEYLIVRVLNDQEARENWARAVVRPQTADSAGGSPEEGGEESAALMPETMPETLVMGQLIMVPGTAVSFYIPPTGVEVVKDDAGHYVRQAVTLERLEYCILLDESGEKRYVRGPDVVFPTPTETFVEEDGKTKFKAIELNDIQGVYVKVIADYEEEDGPRRRAGEELFITGKEQAIYYPRPEHALIKYGDREIHYAVAVPEGEARYVLDRMTGEVKIVRGPTMLLPDPRREVIVRRILTEQQVQLWFPGNLEAERVNEALRRVQTAGSDFITERAASRVSLAAEDDWREEEDGPRYRSATRSLAGERMTRSATFTPPTTVTIDEKYEGAVRIDVWPGYAVLVVDKTGKRRVVVGPESTLLEFGEALLPMTLSTGRPKSDDHPIRTPYLRVRHNTVSDIVSAETSDLFNVEIGLSYRVNFEGEDPESWFGIDNYVKYLTDHLRSLLRHAIKQHGVEHFYANATSIIRDTILGVSGEAGEGRPGRSFEENGMLVYDVEVLTVNIRHEIYELLVQAQQKAVEGELRVAATERTLGFTQREEVVNRQIAEERATTQEASHNLALAEGKRRLEQSLAAIAAEVEAADQRLKADQARQAGLDEVAAAELRREKAAIDQTIAAEREREELAIRAVVERVGAIKPDLVAALQAFGDKELAGKALTSMSPLAMLGGTSVAEVVNRMLNGTVLEGLLQGRSLESGSRDFEDER